MDRHEQGKPRARSAEALGQARDQSSESEPPLLRLSGLSSSCRIRHAITTREGGHSKGAFASLNLGLHVGDDAEAVLGNRVRLAGVLDATADDMIFAEQVHGNRVALVGEADRGRGASEAASALPGTDALITDTPGLWLTILVADCVPLLLADPVRGVIGAAHAGWRGTVADIAGRSVRAMVEGFGCDPADIVAGIGPSIGPEDLEVGPEVAEAFRRAFPDRHPQLIRAGRGDRCLVDLWRANRLQLDDAGLNPLAIDLAGISTVASLERFYSHRAEGGRTGRFAATIALR